jgi:acyl CoA:acetate/3-ketoacid CoA transferase
LTGGEGGGRPLSDEQEIRKEKATEVCRWGTVTSAKKAIEKVRDGDVIAISGFNMATTPEYLILELLRSYQEGGHPRDLFIECDALPAIPGRWTSWLGVSVRQTISFFSRESLSHTSASPLGSRR